MRHSHSFSIAPAAGEVGPGYMAFLPTLPRVIKIAVQAATARASAARSHGRSCPTWWDLVSCIGPSSLVRLLYALHIHRGACRRVVLRRFWAARPGRPRRVRPALVAM